MWQEHAWLNNFSMSLVLSAALPEMVVGLQRYPMHLGQGMPTRVLSTTLWEALYWSGVATVCSTPSYIWAHAVIKEELCNTEQVSC